MTRFEPEGPRPLWFVVSCGAVVAVMLGLASVTLSRSSPMVVPVLSGPSPSRGGSGSDVGTGDPSAGDALRSRTADQLRSMDPHALDRYVAEDDGITRSGQSSAASPRGAWLVGEVGTYLVGRGVEAGKYATAGAKPGKTCRWGVTDRNSAVVISGSGTGRIVVAIHEGDGFFETQGCGNWQRIS